MFVDFLLSLSPKQSSTDIFHDKVTVTSIVQRLVKGNIGDLNGSEMEHKGNNT